MSFDPQVPKELQKILTWFSSIITMPIDAKSRMRALSPSGQPMSEEAKKFIRPSHTMDPHKRIQLYNQQYWWRLLNTLQVSFPMATRLLGYKKFNDEIAIPYLQKYPSRHWSLSFLGERLPGWMENAYRGEDKELLLEAVRVDWAYNFCFFSAHLPPITAGVSEREAATALAAAAHLQPHLFLFALDCDLFAFRTQLRQKDPDFWSSHHFANLKHALADGAGHFPALKRGGAFYFVLYRNRLNSIVYEEIAEAEHALLSKFKEGASLDFACQWLEGDGRRYRVEAQESLQEWVRKWVGKEWLARKV